MHNGTSIRSSSTSRMAHMSDHGLDSLSSSLRPPYYRPPLGHLHWHHCIRRIVRGDSNLAYVVRGLSRRSSSLMLFHRCLVISILCTTPEPMPLAPRSTLALLSTILCLSTTSALGEFPWISFPASAQHFKKIISKQNSKISSTILTICTLSNPTTTIVLPTRIAHNDPRPVLDLGRQSRRWVWQICLTRAGLEGKPLH